MPYRTFDQINGNHPWRLVSGHGYVDYAARTRHGGRVFYFNFDLAKEMGLLPHDHPHHLNPDLSAAILRTFSLQIINEYDLQHGRRIPAADVRPNPYMATRYLQCQHPSKKGHTSGDGRSLWNGVFKAKGVTWDISSCGTGATCLSPATAISGKFYKTGDNDVSYGCGRADLVDGVAASLMSEIFHKNGIVTERTLAVIAYKDGTAINVRAYKNLLRPAHLFRLLKQGKHLELKAAVDYFIQRQVSNRSWPAVPSGKRAYQSFLAHVTDDFARATAIFESEYVFCWLDWDGDNVLMDGAVLDYGSVRQFGLYHHEYRYDDVDRWSTTITEQKNKAKYIVQTFAQIVDFIVTGRKKNINAFRKHASLRRFEQIFAHVKDEMLVYKLGFDQKSALVLLKDQELRRRLHALTRVLSYFEMAKSGKGLYEISDGITADAIYCVRDILREMPAHYAQGMQDMDMQKFIDILRSEYASDQDVALTPARKAKIRQFQRCYRHLLEGVAKKCGKRLATLAQKIAARAALINRYERVTGDAILYVAEKMVKGAESMGEQALHALFRHFVERQVLRPEYFNRRRLQGVALKNKRAKAMLGDMLDDVKEMREGI